MSWRDDWEKGTFRGVPFKWKQAETLVGRKTARHDFPQRDDVYIEDLGKRPREFTLECFVIGEDYISERNALIKALETSGTGILVHPTMGSMLVALNGQVRISESTSEGGMCRFSIPFILAEETKSSSGAVDTTAKVESAVDAAAEAEESDFEDSFDCSGYAQRVVDDAVDTTKIICDKLDALRTAIPTSVETPKFLKNIDAIRNSATMLVNSPLLLAKSIAGQIYFMRNLALAPLDLINSSIATIRDLAKISQIPSKLYDAYSRLFGYGSEYDNVTYSTPSRTRQVQNKAALTALVRRSAIIEAARTSTIISFASYNDAVRVRNGIIDEIDAVSLTASDTIYAAFIHLRAAVIADINTRGADLARIVSYTPPRTEPALVIAHRLYGDATRADEIVARNHIANPLFVPGGVSLEVLSD
jgi:prophage DNA circulation protein